MVKTPDMVKYQCSCGVWVAPLWSFGTTTILPHNCRSDEEYSTWTPGPVPHGWGVLVLFLGGGGLCALCGFLGDVLGDDPWWRIR